MKTLKRKDYESFDAETTVERNYGWHNKLDEVDGKPPSYCMEYNRETIINLKNCTVQLELHEEVKIVGLKGCSWIVVGVSKQRRYLDNPITNYALQMVVPIATKNKKPKKR